MGRPLAETGGMAKAGAAGRLEPKAGAMLSRRCAKALISAILAA